MESWVTIGREDLECWNALVLAESFQKTFTNKRLSIFTCQKVSNEMRYVLGHFFDVVKQLPGDDSPKFESNLEHFLPWSKCIFVDSGCIALENVDDLFDCEENGMTDQVEATALTLCILNKMKTPNSELQSRSVVIRVETEKIVHSTNSKLLRICATDISRRIHQMDARIQLGIVKTAPSHIFEPKPFLAPITSPKAEYLRDAIAIIGISCRFPGANNLEEYWDILKNGRYTVTRFPEGRATFNIAGIQESVAGFLSCPIDEFDPEFFGIDPKEAWSIDPQQRILLEVTWESLEDAGIDTATLRGTNAGVFVGNLLQDYERLLPPNDLVGINEKIRTLGNGISGLSGRISNFLDIVGPSVSQEAGCASGLVALHLACESLLRKDCNLALFGAVNLVISPRAYNTAVLSSDFKCKTFDESADGFVSGEAAGTFVLKRYEDAVKDGDRIRAVIRGTAMSNDGASLCYGTPNPEAHARTHKLAMAKAGVAPWEVQYVETHGTGTQKGDIGEVFGLADAYGGNRKSPLLIGSVKQNIGHGEAAAAIGSAIKLILSLEKEEIPPNIFLNKLNPKINLDVIPGIIPTQLTPWKGESRLAGLSSFSLTGSLVHAILQSTPKTPSWKYEESESDESPQIVTISARSSAALEARRQNFVNFLKANGGLLLADVAYAANACRTHFGQRIALAVYTVQQLVQCLESFDYFSTEVAGDEESGNPAQSRLRNARQKDERAKALEKICELYVRGGSIDWVQQFGQREKRVVLPFYPFQRQKYWFSPHDFPKVVENRNNEDPTMRKIHPLLGWKIPCAIGAIFQNDNPGKLESFSSAGGILEILIAAGKHAGNSIPKQVNLKSIEIFRELSGSCIQTLVEFGEKENGDEQWKLELYQATQNGGWELVASCKMNLATTKKPKAQPQDKEIEVKNPGHVFPGSLLAVAMEVSMGTDGSQHVDGQILLPLAIKSCQCWEPKVAPIKYFCSGGNGAALIGGKNDEILLSFQLE